MILPYLVRVAGHHSEDFAMKTPPNVVSNESMSFSSLDFFLKIFKVDLSIDNSNIVLSNSVLLLGSIFFLIIYYTGHKQYNWYV